MCRHGYGNANASMKTSFKNNYNLRVWGLRVRAQSENWERAKSHLSNSNEWRIVWLKGKCMTSICEHQSLDTTLQVTSTTLLFLIQTKSFRFFETVQIKSFLLHACMFIYRLDLCFTFIDLISSSHVVCNSIVYVRPRLVMHGAEKLIMFLTTNK